MCRLASRQSKGRHQSAVYIFLVAEIPHQHLPSPPPHTFPAPPPFCADGVSILLTGALEAEEVGVEHLLRDINDPSVSSLANQVRHLVQTMKGGRSPSDGGVRRGC